MDIPLPTPTHDSTRISHSHSHSRRDTSPLLTLPPELLALLALHLATRPPNLGPPAALLPLLLTCRFLYSQLGFPYTRGRGNAALWARIGRAKFARGSIVASGDGVGDEPLSESLPRSIFGDVSRTGMETSPSTSRRMSTTTSKTERAATRFRTLLTALRDIRAGDVHDPRAGWALVVAYGMVVEDDLDAEGEGDSDDPHGTVKAEGNKTMPALSMEASGAWREGGMEGLRMREAAEAASSSTIITSPPSPSSSARSLPSTQSHSRTKAPFPAPNRRQLAWAGAREFALRYVRERGYEGRWGEGEAVPRSRFRSPRAGAHGTAPFDESAELETRSGRLEGRHEWKETRPEWHTPTWRVGWPRDAAAGAAALWVGWFFEGEDTLAAESEPARRALMALLLPFVVVPFRYPSTLLPPHHYSVPLATPTLDAAPITVPTFHGAYPVYSYPPVPPSHTPTSRPSATSRPPQAGVPRAPQARPDIQSPLPTSTSISRRAPPAQIGRALHARLLTAPPARLLFFARMQAAARMGVPPHLARDRAAADARFVGNGGTGPPPIGPTQADIYEKNARPVVRFERQLPSAPSTQSSSGAAFPSTATATSSASSTSTSVPTSISAPTRNDPLAILPILDSDSDSDSDTGESRSSGVKRKRKRDTRWAPDAWRARLCVGYGGVWGDAASVVTAPSPSASSSRVLLPGAASTSAAASAARTPAAGTGTSASAGASGVSRGTGQAHVPRGGAPPGRIGRVYELGSMAGLWAGTMLMPSEPPYNALLATPGGAFPASGLARDDFVAAARPVYMRIEEHWSFHPHTPAPPPRPDATTGDEGLRAGWLPPSTRVVGVGGGRVEVRCETDGSGATGYGGRARHGAEDAYTYETVLEGRVREGAHDAETCPGCERARRRERARRAGGGAAYGPQQSYVLSSEEDDMHAVEEDDEEMVDHDAYDADEEVIEGEADTSRSSEESPTRSSEDSPSEESGQGQSSADEHSSPPDSDESSSRERGSSADGVLSTSTSSGDAGGSSSRTNSSSSPVGAGSFSPVDDARSPSDGAVADDAETGDPSATWPEWDAPAWAAYGFDTDEGWEGACDGVQDVVFTGATDPHHGQAWHHYEYAGRVRPWDGLIGLVMRPRDRTLGLATYFISGHLVGRDTFEGTWQMAAQDVLAPSWGGSVCFARGAE